MRFSEHELHRMACTATTQSTMQGKLFYKGAQQGKLRPVQGQAFREREFRLQGNFLFYYKTNEDRRAPEPLGALLLERFSVQREMNAEKGFLFSIAFQDDRERKHLFLASSAQQCDQWVAAIRSASYEQLKSTWIILRSKIKRLVDMSQTTNSEQQSQPGAMTGQAKAPPRPPPPRPPPPASSSSSSSSYSSQPRQPSSQVPIQPMRSAPQPPSSSSASTPQGPAEGLLLDFS